MPPGTAGYGEGRFCGLSPFIRKGAVKYSTAFAKAMTSYDETERQELFYDSVQEKMDELSPRTMGILLQESKDEKGLYFLTTIANYNVDVEYRICTLDEQGVEKGN